MLFFYICAIVIEICLSDPIPSGIDREFEYAIRLDNMGQAELLMELRQNALQLCKLLELEGPPTYEQTHLRLNAGDHNLYIPDSLVASFAAKPLFDEIIISSSINREKQVGSIAVTITGSATNGQEIILNVYPDDDTAVTSLLMGESMDEMPVLQQGTPADISRLLASIYLPNKTADYEMFDKLDIKDPMIIYNLTEALKKHAHSVTHTGMFNDNGAITEYTKYNDTVTEVIYQSRSNNGTPIIVQASQGDLPTALLLSGEFSIDGVEVYTGGGRKELPAFSLDQLRERCIELRQRRLAYGEDQPEILVSTETMQEIEELNSEE